MALTNKQKAFVEYYLQSWNATQAARAAGYSEHTAPQIGAENLRKPQIYAHVRERISQIAMSADEVLLRLADHARGTMEDFINPDSLTVDLTQARNNSKLHLVKKVKYVTRTDDESQTETVEFELYDAQAALVHLGRHHGLFVDKTELTGKDGEPLPAPIIYLPALTDDNDGS